MALDERHTEPTDSTDGKSTEQESVTPVTTPIESHASTDVQSTDEDPTESMEPVESQELGVEYPPQHDLVLCRTTLGFDRRFNPIELMPFEWRRREVPPAPEGLVWVMRNDGSNGGKEPGMFLYEKTAMWLLDMHRKSKAEAEVAKIGGWGMQVAGALRDWDLCVEVGDEEDRDILWDGRASPFIPGEPYEEWPSEIVPPNGFSSTFRPGKPWKLGAERSAPLSIPE